MPCASISPNGFGALSLFWTNPTYFGLVQISLDRSKNDFLAHVRNNFDRPKQFELVHIWSNIYTV